MTAADKAIGIGAARRIVLKIGSALLIDDALGALRRDWLRAFAEDVARLRNDGREVAIVSSGAIAFGRRQLDLSGKALALEEKQAAAAVGQIHLAHAWQEALAAHGLTLAQILLSLADTEERRRHLNARETLSALFEFGAVPLINENDTVATEEIRFGDNDRLAARVAQMAGADLLVLLSDIDGLYDRDPRLHADAAHIPEVPALTDEIRTMAGKPRPGYSSGGMVTKLEAARIAVGAGCAMIISDGRAEHPIRRLDAGERHTRFAPAASPGTARKRWIAGALGSDARIAVDAGAANALRRGKSLLPAGVTAVEGNFRRGDAVRIVGPDGAEIAIGLIAYDAEAARTIAGRQSGEIEALLGYKGRDVLVHRDDMVERE
ncbi:MAG: glutamate 5-kinase [Rhodospirillaceae bacterium]|nr:glutamate 5-kinase [Rhodospirillaceae bacterium]MYB13303.1 glutamate 5-kinase [Rhodospirillaceae bacterium]MYI50474.1 glutamate 5-kinase [Rhodospirillaceae bacterium]